MKKDIIQKIISGGVFVSSDLTSDEKKRLHALMKHYGASEGYSYNRFFQRGFSQWELKGIEWVKAEYLNVMEREGTDVSGYRNLTETERNQPGAFFNFLKEQRHVVRFDQWMADAGMRSAVTVAKRFGSDNWLPFELRGIESILSEFSGNNNG